MKTKLIILAALLLLAACSSNETEVINHEVGDKVPVRVHVNEFSISVSDFDDFVAGTRVGTRAESAKNYEDVKACVLAFYDVEGTEVYKKTQVRGDASTYTTFGNFKADLQIGHYKMVALGYNVGNNDEFTLTSPTQAGYTSEKPREMFCLVQDVTVTRSDTLNLDVTLNRLGAYLKILSTDGRSAGVTKIRTTFGNGGKTFNPSTGLALTNDGFDQTNNSSAKVGETIEINCFPYLFTDEQKMDVTIDALDSDGKALFSKVITGVEFKRGYITTIKGPIFTAGTSAVGFQFNTEWGEGKTYTFE